MTRTSLRRLSPLLVLLLVVGLALGSCSSDDSDDEGQAPTTAAPGSDDDEETTAPAEEATPTTAGGDPVAAAIEAQQEALGIAAVRQEGDTQILVMESGSTEDDLAPACEFAATLVPDSAVSTDLDGTVTPCP